MLPVAILIATTAMASGAEGATFFSPLFILALEMPPKVAIGRGVLFILVAALLIRAVAPRAP